MSEASTPGEEANRPTSRLAKVAKVGESGLLTKFLLLVVAAFQGYTTDRLNARVAAAAKTVTAEAKDTGETVAVELAVLKLRVGTLSQDIAVLGVDTAVIKETTGDLAAKIPAQIGKLTKRVERNEHAIAQWRAERH